MKDLSIKLSEYKIDRPSGDYSRANNGGDYEFGHRDVIRGGQVIGELLYTSSEFDYCNLSGTFTRTRRVDVAGTDISFDADVQKGIEEEISQEEFVSWLN